MFKRRKMYFLEDDYCQQQLLPRAATAFVEGELKKSAEFARAHKDPDGAGWTDVYVRGEGPVEMHSLAIKKEQFGEIIEPIMPPFHKVYTASTINWKICPKTAAWGVSGQCAVLADWGDAGNILNVWAEFSDKDEAAIVAASKAVFTLAKVHPLLYVDWAWHYTCDAADETTFALLLPKKLDIISERLKKD